MNVLPESDIQKSKIKVFNLICIFLLIFVSACATRLSHYEIEEVYNAAHNTNTSIILIHGLGSNQETWKVEMQALTDSLNAKNVYTFEYPTNILATDKQVPTIPELAKTLYAKINKKQITGNIILIGHSMGGLVSLEYTLKNPQLVSKVILLGSPVMGSIMAEYSNLFGRASKQTKELKPFSKYINDLHSRLENNQHKLPPILSIIGRNDQASLIKGRKTPLTSSAYLGLASATNYTIDRFHLTLTNIDTELLNIFSDFLRNDLKENVHHNPPTILTCTIPHHTALFGIKKYTPSMNFDRFHGISTYPDPNGIINKQVEIPFEDLLCESISKKGNSTPVCYRNGDQVIIEGLSQEKNTITFSKGIKKYIKKNALQGYLENKNSPNFDVHNIFYIHEGINTFAENTCFEFKYKKYKPYSQKLKNNFHYYKNLANNGNSTAMLLVGNFYDYGMLVEKNKTKSIEYYKKSALLGIPLAQLMYAMKLIENTPDISIQKEALMHLTKAAKQNEVGAQLYLGTIYTGFNSSINSDLIQDKQEEGLEWLKKAKQQGNFDAARIIAYIQKQTYPLNDIYIPVH